MLILFTQEQTAMNDRAFESLHTEFNAAGLAAELLRNNTVLIQKIGVALDCSGDEVHDALREVLRFMFLTANDANGQLTPSHRVELCSTRFRHRCVSHRASR